MQSNLSCNFYETIDRFEEKYGISGIFFYIDSKHTRLFMSLYGYANPITMLNVYTVTVWDSITPTTADSISKLLRGNTITMFWLQNANVYRRGILEAQYAGETFTCKTIPEAIDYINRLDLLWSL